MTMILSISRISIRRHWFRCCAFSPETVYGPARSTAGARIVTEAPARERNMANAPLAEDGLFLVPQVIE